MSAIESTEGRTHLSTLTERQAKLLLQAKQKVLQTAAYAKDAEEQYNSLLTMVMPDGANHFDPATFSFFYVEPPDPTSEPATDTEDS